MIVYAGGFETRESIKCKDCDTKRRPLKWYDLWSSWLCPSCNELRITAGTDQIEHWRGG